VAATEKADAAGRAGQGFGVEIGQKAVRHSIAQGEMRFRGGDRWRMIPYRR
jgi:uncharacterized 2Fe-2S/4Fe-4S cluster protein (DUF4445 family)